MVVLLLLAAGLQPVAPPKPQIYFPSPRRLPAGVPTLRANPLSASQPHVLFVNFGGAHLTGNSSCSDATQNCSFIVSGGSYNFQAAGLSAQQQQDVMSNLQMFYQPFNVQLVTTRPASGNYSMVMVGCCSSVLGQTGTGAAGVAPLDCQDMNPVDISFAFTDVLGTNTFDIAVTAAQESAHGFGLGHTNNQHDIQYPVLNETMPKSFVNQNMMIYDAGGSSSDCNGSGMQNSYMQLITNVGAADTGPDTTPPMISFISPHNGDTVPSGFDIQFDASDNRAVTAVDLYIDGNKAGGLGQSPWTFTIPGGLIPAGMHKFKGVARDAANNATTSDEITVIVKALGTSPGDLGSSCNTDADCPGGFCAFDSGANKHFCTRTCDTMNNACPNGFSCVNAGGPMVCAPATNSGGGGGGCAVGGHDTPLAGILLLGLGAFALVLARLRRR